MSRHKPAIPPPGPPSATPLTDAPWADYRPAGGAFDELFEPDGKPRAHAAKLGAAVAQMGAGDLEKRWDRAQRELRENGVTYNVYDDSQGTDRPWQLDPIPLLITQDEFQQTAAGLSQRAHLLNAILGDLYGEQALVREGLLPPELVFQNPGFLRPCHERDRRNTSHLQLYAADLLRGEDGRLRVLGDRTQAPSGMGYALENRIVLSRAFPNLYRDSRVERLAPFFRSLLDTIVSLSPRRNERPHAVLLTPGPYNETYFEHAYLARYLGLTLVEGGDLTVRRRVVYLKTLGGLQRVDVVLRRLDDSFCDPLSLRSDSALGVAGLLAAVRAGNVAVLNGLGSGAVETPALLPFLPALCQRLRGEPLQLPSVPTLWCGQRRALEQVLDTLDTQVLKPAYPQRTSPEPVFGGALDAAGRAALMERLRAEPSRYVAQTEVMLSTAPNLGAEGLSPRPVALRCYAVAEGQDYRVMTGALARVSHEPDNPRVSMQSGAGSKDAWVLADGPVRPVSLLGPGDRRLELSRGGGDLPSRVADNLFWLGRYLERVEGSARLLREIFARLTDELPAADSPELPVLCHALSVHIEHEVRISYEAGESGPDKLERDLLDFLRDTGRYHSLLSLLSGVHRAAFTVRERLSSDTWRVLGQLRSQQVALGAARDLNAADVLDHLNGIVVSAAAFSGLQMESLSRTLAYRFVDLGRRLERAQNTGRLLWSSLVSAQREESAVLISVLSVLDNAITYRRRYQGVVQLAPALDLLLIDEDNPRSLAFQFAMLHEHVQHLPLARARPFRTREEQLVMRALTNVRLADIESLCEPADNGHRPGLDAHLQELLAVLPELSDAITQSYLAHAIPQQSLGVRQLPSLRPAIAEPVVDGGGDGAEHGGALQLPGAHTDEQGRQQSQQQSQQQTRGRGRP